VLGQYNLSCAGNYTFSSNDISTPIKTAPQALKYKGRFIERPEGAFMPDNSSVNEGIIRIIEEAEKPKATYSDFFTAIREAEEHFKTDRESVRKAAEEESKERESKL